MNFIKNLFNRKDEYIFNKGIEEFSISNSLLEYSLRKTHKTIDDIWKRVPSMTNILGTSGLSGFVGELFANHLKENSKGYLMGNLYSQGNPDILVMTNKTKDMISSYRKGELPITTFRRFAGDGMEVKATVFRSYPRVSWGENRIENAKAVHWMSHHPEVNYLLGLSLDFFKGKPKICGMFFSPQLTIDDWSKRSETYTHGTRVTSSCTLRTPGVKKMGKKWICIIKDNLYLNFYRKKMEVLVG